MSAHKRFIAGAVCPSCEQLDKLYVFTDDHGQRICECAACGFRDERTRSALPGTPEYQRGLGDPELQVVRLLDPGGA